eukprot:10630608-Karenia_brevis.AAC.1
MPVGMDMWADGRWAQRDQLQGSNHDMRTARRQSAGPRRDQLQGSHSTAVDMDMPVGMDMRAFRQWAQCD